jgi:hypothetical protein
MTGPREVQNLLLGEGMIVLEPYSRRFHGKESSPLEDSGMPIICIQVRDLANHCIFCGEFGIVGHRSLRRNRKVATEVRKITEDPAKIKSVTQRRNGN